MSFLQRTFQCLPGFYQVVYWFTTGLKQRLCSNENCLNQNARIILPDLKWPCF